FYFNNILSHLKFTLFPYTTLFRSKNNFYLFLKKNINIGKRKYPCCYTTELSIFFGGANTQSLSGVKSTIVYEWLKNSTNLNFTQDRKSTRLNSSHLGISYAVFCLK